MAGKRDAELGAASSSWVLQVLVVLAVLGLLGYEAISIGLTSVSVDDASRQVARAAAGAYRSSDGSLEQATEAANEAAQTHGATVLDVVDDGEELAVTLRKVAPTVLVHRLAATRDLATRQATGRAPLALP